MTTIRKTLKGATRRAAFDLKAMSEEIGATVKEGRISEARGRYYLTTGVKKLEIAGDPAILADIKKLAGQVVPVMIAGKTIIAVGNLRGPHCYFTCYVPSPDFAKEINQLTRFATIDKFEKEKVITSTLAQRLRQASGFDAVLF